MSDDVGAFIAARLDEDEAAATLAMPGPWQVNFRDVLVVEAAVDGHRIAEAYQCQDLVHDRAATWSAAHIARHDPARVLREVAAKRAVLEAYEGQDGWDLPHGVRDGRDPDERSCDEAINGMLLAVVQTLATTWSDHPDYRAEWKP